MLSKEINLYQSKKIDNNLSMSQASNQLFMDKGNCCDCHHDLTAIVDFHRLLYIFRIGSLQTSILISKSWQLFASLHQIKHRNDEIWSIPDFNQRRSFSTDSIYGSNVPVITDWKSNILCKSNHFTHSHAWYWLINWLSIINFHWFLWLVSPRWNLLHYFSCQKEV